LVQERPRGLRHIALATDTLGQRRVLDRLEWLAIPHRCKRHHDHDSVYFADPDGSTLEIMVPTT
jgi:catechol 2,3-dioxygenase-like lactoylglutathione lyase family enzyme